MKNLVVKGAYKKARIITFEENNLNYFFVGGDDFSPQRNYMLLADIRYLFLVSPSILSPPPPPAIHSISFRSDPGIISSGSLRDGN